MAAHSSPSLYDGMAELIDLLEQQEAITDPDDEAAIAERLRSSVEMCSPSSPPSAAHAKRRPNASAPVPPEQTPSPSASAPASSMS